MRPTIEETMLRVAQALADRGTCVKMKVGCVLTDSRGNIVGTGYNGVARGMQHCNHIEPGKAGMHAMHYAASPLSILRVHPELFPHACAGAASQSGADLCEAVHAEQNALTRCKEPDAAHTCYTTVSPCMRCVKQLLNTGCVRIVFLQEYDREPQARELWTRTGRTWQFWKPTDSVG
jgi:dCMP deaminase